MNEADMYVFRVYCNRSLIASFRSESERNEFINARKSLYPKNHYGDSPIR